MFEIANITTASPTVRLKFDGRGSVFPDGAFGGGTVEIYFVARGDIVSSTSAYSIDGTTIKTADLPYGTYDIVLENSVAGDLDIFYGGQQDAVRT